MRCFAGAFADQLVDGCAVPVCHNRQGIALGQQVQAHGPPHQSDPDKTNPLLTHAFRSLMTSVEASAGEVSLAASFAERMYGLEFR